MQAERRGLVLGAALMGLVSACGGGGEDAPTPPPPSPPPSPPPPPPPPPPATPPGVVAGPVVDGPVTILASADDGIRTGLAVDAAGTVFAVAGDAIFSIEAAYRLRTRAWLPRPVYEGPGFGPPSALQAGPGRTLLFIAHDGTITDLLFGLEPDGRIEVWGASAYEAGLDGGFAVTAAGSVYFVKPEDEIQDRYGRVHRSDAPGDRQATFQFARGGNGMSQPRGPLVASADGTVYGPARAGVHGFEDGNTVSDTIFRITPAGTLERVRTFDIADPPGADLAHVLAIDADDRLVGATTRGGAAGFGTLWRLRGDATEPTVLHDFDRAGVSAVRVGRDGRILGTIASGGAGGRGVIFRVEADGSGYTELHAFDASLPPPQGPLVLGPDDALYGTLIEVVGYGRPARGAIFRFPLPA